MAIQLLRLRGVPEDELEDLYALLDQHGIDFYETSAGNWGISMPALWLSDESQYPRARALMDEYQAQRLARVRAEYEALRKAGRQRRYRDIIAENPARFLLYTALVAGLIYLSIGPYFALSY